MMQGYCAVYLTNTFRFYWRWMRVCNAFECSQPHQLVLGMTFHKGRPHESMYTTWSIEYITEAARLGKGKSWL